jgi:monoamine oxidase
MDRKTVIIIGAGASGLMAAKELTGDYDVIILEADSRAGGRIYSISSHAFPEVIEAGAEFIHGHQKETIRILKAAKVDYVPVDGKMYRREKGEWKEQTERIEGWEDLLKKMKKVKKDESLRSFLHNYFGDDKYASLRRHATNYAEGFDLADTSKASVRSLYQEWTNEEEDIFRIPSGYGALIDYLKKECEQTGCRLLTDHTVKQVDWEKNDVTVYTQNKQIFSANKLIVTVPLSVLVKAGAKSSINFTPPLDDYIAAANKIGMGDVVKVVFHFHERLWKEDMGFLFSDEIFPTWWTQLPGEQLMLTGWCGGPKAATLSSHTDEEILEKAVLSLSTILDTSVDALKKNLRHASVFNWQSEQLHLHGYSYDTLESVTARKLLNTPVANTIFFAGEALYEGRSPGTVESALVSGKNAAAKLIAS